MNKSAWSPDHIRDVLRELADDNPLGCGGLLSRAIVDINANVPVVSLDLSRGDTAQFLLNPDFLNRHVDNEDDLRVIFMREYLHALIRHLGCLPRWRATRPAVRMALTAVTNHIVNRELEGASRSGCFARLHPVESQDCPSWVLRPYPEGEPANVPSLTGSAARYRARPMSKLQTIVPHQRSTVAIATIRDSLATGAILADNIKALSKMLDSLSVDLPRSVHVPGESAPRTVHRCHRSLLDETLKQIDISRIIQGTPPERPRSMTWSPFSTKDAWQQDVVRRIEALLARIPFGQDGKAAPSALYVDTGTRFEEELKLLPGVLQRLPARIQRPVFTYAANHRPQPLPANVSKLHPSDWQVASLGTLIGHLTETRPTHAIFITYGTFTKPKDDLIAKLADSGIRLDVLVANDGFTAGLKRFPVSTHRLPPTPILG